jgi:DNA polymerase I
MSLLNYRKMKRLLSDRLFTGELIGADGRLHPDHRALGAESGRNTMRWPNLGGIGRAFRPLVVPRGAETQIERVEGDSAGTGGELECESWGVGEVDFNQIEMMIAAAETRDPDLLAMVNGGDLYCAMARRFHADRLPAGARELSDADIKKHHVRERNEMKILALALMYILYAANSGTFSNVWNL